MGYVMIAIVAFLIIGSGYFYFQYSKGSVRLSAKDVTIDITYNKSAENNLTNSSGLASGDSDEVINFEKSSYQNTSPSNSDQLAPPGPPGFTVSP